MKILHIASISNSKLTGVSMVVPMHIKYQSKFAETKLINVDDVVIEKVTNQISYKDKTNNQLKNLFKEFDLIIFHEVYRIQYIRLYKLLLEVNKPYIIIPHGELSKIPQHQKWLKKKVANILLFNRFVKHSLAIQCLSENEKENTLFNKNKIVSTNGIEIPSIHKDKFNENKIKFTYIGRLAVEHKGLDLLIQGIALSKDKLKEHNCSFDIYGPDRENRFQMVQELIKENDVEDIVSLHHEIVDQEKINVLLDTDIFIQTSRFEGMPMGILEALSYGIPVFVTEGTCVGNFINNYQCGWVAKTCKESISNTLIKCLDNLDLKDKSKNGINLICDNFDWNIVAKQAIDKYQELINK